MCVVLFLVCDPADEKWVTTHKTAAAPLRRRVFKDQQSGWARRPVLKLIFLIFEFSYSLLTYTAWFILRGWGGRGGGSHRLCGGLYPPLPGDISTAEGRWHTELTAPPNSQPALSPSGQHARPSRTRLQILTGLQGPDRRHFVSAPLPDFRMSTSSRLDHLPACATGTAILCLQRERNRAHTAWARERTRPTRVWWVGPWNRVTFFN